MKRETKKLLAQLGKPHLYEIELERIRHNNQVGGRLMTMTQRGASLSALSFRPKKLARLLCKTVRSGNYIFDPSEERQALAKGKVRIFCRTNITDTIVSGAVTRVVEQLVIPSLSDRVYSYQKGKSAWLVLSHFSEHLRAHVDARPDPKDRGMYVLKRDVTDYNPCIPVHEGSLLWTQFQDALFRDAGVPEDHYIWPMIQKMVRPVVRQLDGNLASRRIGISIGMMIQQLISNLYLSPLDHGMEKFEGAFYARYGDDFVFAHRDPTVVQRASAKMDEILEFLGLVCSPEKSFDYYFTGAGRPSFEWPESIPATHLEYLGSRLNFDGTIGLKTEKGRDVLVTLRARIANAMVMTEGLNKKKRLRTICAVANRSLNPKLPFSIGRSVLIHNMVDDRSQLKHFDYLVALMVAESLSGLRGPKAFRHYPYRMLRRKGRLASLLVQHDRKRKDVDVEVEA